MSLKEYRRKRDFKVTSEPGPQAKARKRRKPTFVIQEHHATRLHYDFRLEADGVLKSWAVTKEPTSDPKIRRLAIEVEDHPLAYATFSGDIPEGQYGAGHVEIWDSGEYDNVMADKDEPMTVSESIDAGHVEVELHGERLKGKFVLIRTGERSGKNQWLLIKMKDEHAVTDASPQKKETTSRRGATSKRTSRGSKTAASTSRSSKARITREGDAPDEVRRTNEDKVMFPESGITKGEMLEYYERVAPLMLPHLKDRPITIERYPDGIGEGSPSFWQKNTPTYYPDWIARVDQTTQDGKPISYTVVNDVETLLYLVNQGAITFHVWTSRVENMDRPDYVLFDLDPGDREFSDVVTVARALHEILEARGIESVVKTSGKSGLHVLVAWVQDGDHDAAREWAMEIAQELVATLPDVATTERSKAKRKGRLYVDVMQNERGKHVVAPYTLRATPEATVSMPLEWSEVKKGLSPRKFTLKTATRRLAKRASDPMDVLTQATKPKGASSKGTAKNRTAAARGSAAAAPKTAIKGSTKRGATKRGATKRGATKAAVKRERTKGAAKKSAKR